MNDVARLLRNGNRLLLLLLICLKLTGDLSWSWFVVLAPAWVPMLGLMLGLAAMIAFTLLRKGQRSPLASLGRCLLRSPVMSVRQAFAARAMPRP
jgi:hypothetical protein